MCFIEEVPEKTLVAGYYDNPDLQKRNEAFPQQQQKLMITVTDPDKAVVFNGVAEGMGEFRFVSHNAGEYLVCVKGEVPYYSGVGGKKLRFHLHLEKADKAINYEEVAKKEQLGELEVTVRKLNDKVRKGKG
jgi:hypothetical protein